MANIELIEQIAETQIKESDKIQIEYQQNNIIIVDTLLNELYHYIYNADDDINAHDKIMKLVSNEKIQPYYDNKLMFFKVKLIGILNNNNWCINALSDDVKISYSWIVNQLITELKKYN